ncbi:MAG TPA: protein kinase, partial [Vicinamibacterales bacterium]|nr:protein kinase [Vicinamibacterales bacterium]
MSDVIPATLGDYRIEGLLGQGRVGHVFRGSHMVLGMPVALRVIDAKYASAPGLRTRLVQYAHSLTPVVHPNVVRVYHCGEHEGLVYIVNELVSGGTPELPQPDASWSSSTWANVSVVRQAAEGLAAVHGRGLVHGDLRRTNVRLSQSDVGLTQAKLSDSGLLALVDESSAPRDVHDGVARDLTQLGAVVYELTTGRAFAEGRAPQFPKGFPGELRLLIVRCLGLDSAKRFSSCTEVTEALGVVLARERPIATDRGRTARVEEDVDPTPAPPPVVVTPVVRRNVNPPRPPAPLAPGGPKVPCLHAFDEAGTPIDTQFVRSSGLTIGRASANVIVLPSAAVGSTHARIDWDAHRVTVTDLGSDVGTLLQGQRLLPQVAQEWGPEQWLQVGPYWLWLQRPSADPTAINTTEAMLDHESKSLVITPGKGAVCRLTLVNQRAQVDHIKISVEGIPGEWVELPNAPPQLNAFQKQEIAIPVNVPKSAMGKAGDYKVT